MRRRNRRARSLRVALFLLAIIACPSPSRFPLWGQEPRSESKPEEKREELPLTPTETIEFVTDEGTWMSLDVSPDGQTIVFDLLGDLYVLPITGGEAKRIFGGMSFESQPRFSPDGKRIVFLSDRSGAENVWVANADGSDPRPVTKGRHQMFASPTWTPDGRYIVVSRSTDPIGTFSLWMYHIEGGTGVQIGPPDPPLPEPDSQEPARPRQNKLGAVVSPDGRYLYYSVRTGAFTYNAMFPLWQIVRFDRETGETTTLTNAQGSAMRPVLSPDGKRLVYATRYETGTGLRIRDLETGEERWLIYPVTRDDQESRATRDTMPGYAFLPDGRALIVPIEGKIWRVDVETGQRTLIPFTAKVEAEIGPRAYFQYRVEDSPMVRARLIRWPTLSPDGRRLAFTAFNRIWIMEWPSGTPRRLTNASVGEFMPTWSPDGRYIAYVTWTPQGGHIFRAAVDGGSPPEPLTRRPAYYSSPVYSPDGSKIVFISGPTRQHLYAELRERASGPRPDLLSEGAHAAEITGIPPRIGLDLRWIPAEGGGSRLIGPTQGGISPHFAREPDRIYMTTSRGLVSLRLDGRDRRTHFRVRGSAPGPFPPDAEEIRLSPDGERAFVSLQNKLYLIPVPKAGGETITIAITPNGPSAVPVKRLSLEGGDYLNWTADGKAITWSWGARFYRQDLSAEKPDMTDVVVEVPRARPTGTIVLSGARLITMKGDEVIERGDIVITGNRIVAIGPKGRVPIPAGARVLDVTGKTIIPGFVDVHAHMWPPRGVHQTQVWQYLANLAYGVTTTRDPQSSTTDVFAYADLVEAGEILGPRIFSTGPGVFSRSGLDDLDATRALLKRYKEAYQTNTLKQYVAGDRIVRQWVVMACRELGITPTTEGALDMKLDLTQMADGFSGQEHALPIQPLYKDVIEFVARTKTFYTPTILVAYGAPFTENYYFTSHDVHGDRKLRRFIPHEVLDTMVRRRRQWFLAEEYGHTGIARACAAIVRAGGRVCLGSHGQLQGLGAHWELWSIASGGMSPHEALKVATIFGAEAIGLQQDLGSLEVGKLADLLVLDRNPLVDLRHTVSIRYVMKNGFLFDGDTLDQLWPVPKKLERQYWWEDDPPPATTNK
ncbi:Dipeptidyl-peptidase 5 [bacterium HR08]|nr:Dipeptidyl-peptidase 5 [bacterium HR08]